MQGNGTWLWVRGNIEDLNRLILYLWSPKVQDDLRQKKGWKGHKAILLDLPSCSCCQQLSPGEPESDGGCVHGSRVRAIAATEEGLGVDGQATETLMLVFAVNAAWPLPTTRYSMVSIVTAPLFILQSWLRALGRLLAPVIMYGTLSASR